MKNIRRIIFLFPLVFIVSCIVITGVYTEVRSNPETLLTPVGRFGHVMVFDPIRKCTILFGGTADNSLSRLFNDTWIYNYSDNTWKRINPTNCPPARMNHGMVYDSINQKVIMFGGAGLDLDNPYNDTWIFDYTGNTWTNIDSLKEEKNDSISGNSFVFTLGALFCTIYIINKKKIN